MTRAALAAKFDDRRSDRAEARIAAGLHTAQGRRVPIVIRNLSCHGFMAEGAAVLVPGSLVKLAVADLPDIEARIVWRRDGHIGVSFMTPLAEEDVAKIL